jgi:hypothetical protein
LPNKYPGTIYSSRNWWVDMITLSYEGKKSRQEVIEGTPLLSLTQVKQYGKEWWSGWQNILIFGDNLLALRSLM